MNEQIIEEKFKDCQNMKNLYLSLKRHKIVYKGEN